MLFARSAHDNSKYQNNKNTGIVNTANERTHTRKRRRRRGRRTHTHITSARNKKPNGRIIVQWTLGWLAFNFIYGGDVPGVYCFSVFSVIFFFFSFPYIQFISFVFAYILCHVFLLCFLLLLFRRFFTFITAMCAELNMITAFKQLQFHTKLVTTASQ